MVGKTLQDLHAGSVPPRRRFAHPAGPLPRGEAHAIPMPQRKRPPPHAGTSAGRNIRRRSGEAAEASGSSGVPETPQAVIGEDSSRSIPSQRAVHLPETNFGLCGGQARAGKAACSLPQLWNAPSIGPNDIEDGPACLRGPMPTHHNGSAPPMPRQGRTACGQHRPNHDAGGFG